MVTAPLPATFATAFRALCHSHGLDPAHAAAELAADLVFANAADARAYVLLPSGRVLDLINPSPLDIEPEDITAGQAATIRWGGATSHNEQIRDAQHACLTLEILRQDTSGQLPYAVYLAALTHDSSEGPLGFDPISPLKPFLGVGYRRLDARLQETIHARLGLPRTLPPEWKSLIKAADIKAAASEAHHMTPWTSAQIRKSLKITTPPLTTDPLHRRHGTTPWTPWTRDQSAAIFGAELDRLMRLVSRS